MKILQTIVLLAATLLPSGCSEASGPAPARVSPPPPVEAPRPPMMTTVRDTWLLVRQTDFKNYARVHHGTPTEGDKNTWADRTRKGESVIRLPAGTQVERLVDRVVTLEGKELRFTRVRVADGSVYGANGQPKEGNVPTEDLRDL